MGRSPCCSKDGLNKGAWTALEDKTLKSYIKAHGEGNWRSLPKRAGLKRCGKSCRLRWLNYLRPDIKRGNISGDEEELIIRLHNLLGNRWSLIAGRLPGRTDNEIKNYWNTTLGKKAKQSPNSSTQKIQSQSKEEKLTNNISNNSNSDVKVTITKASRCSTKVIVLPPNNPHHDHYKPLEKSPVNDHIEALTNSSDHENYSFDLFVEDLGFSLDTHEPVLDDWDLSLDQGDQNPNMELDPLAFLLDSEEWPCLI